MPATNATTAKKAVIDLLKTFAVPAGSLEGVDVRYSGRGPMGAKTVYAGGWHFDQRPAVAETPGLLVNEDLLLVLVIKVVQRPACDPEITDLLADGITSAVAVILKANPKLAGGLSFVGIPQGDGDYMFGADETVSTHALQVRIGSTFGWG